VKLNAIYVHNGLERLTDRNKFNVRCILPVAIEGTMDLQELGTIIIGISVSHCGEYEDDGFWDIAPCMLVQADRRFRGAYCLHHQDDDNLI
jgi:hypothetical protein